MELFITVGVVWFVGMVGYAVLSSGSSDNKKRCNVRKEVMEFKELNRQMNTTVNKRGR